MKVSFKGHFRKAWFDKDVQTDKEGNASIEWEAEPKSGRLFAACSKPDFVPIHCLWGEGQGEVAIPEHVDLQFQQGKLVGGVVQDQDGHPIIGAKVKVNKIVDLPKLAYYWFNVAELTTDANGRWQWKGVPSDLDTFQVDIEHPDFVAGDNRLQSGIQGVYTMKRGQKVTGRVLTAEGTPIEAANVLLGFHHNWAGASHVTTDFDGRFTFKNCKPGESLVTVEVDDFSPDQREVVVGKQEDVGEFRLAKGHTMRVRIVDSNGNPIKGATLRSGFLAKS